MATQIGTKTRLLTKILYSIRLVRTALRISGGPVPLIVKVLRALKQGGIDKVRQRTRTLHIYTDIQPRDTQNLSFDARNSTQRDGLPWMPKLLFIDWSTPRPDRDAGSQTAFSLLEIYVNIGYDVTFIPSDLQYLGKYTEDVRALGVRCPESKNAVSIEEYLQSCAQKFDYVFICRAPIAGLYIDAIRRFSPDAKIILNTSDLHYLRDLREAELLGSPEKLAAAIKAKDWELGIIRQCDITIVMSTIEAEILAEELPDTNVKLIPLMFVEVAPDCPDFDDRSDYLFIGGFPHQPNVDAVLYFTSEILPLVQLRLPEARFHIVGNAPPPSVINLADKPGVIVHGYVEDIADIFRRVKLSVAPLRYGAGIKGKVGTSLAYGVPVVASSMAVEGMNILDGKHVLVADTPGQFADAITLAYTNKEVWQRLSDNGRDQMLRSHSLAAGQARISELMKQINPNHRQVDFYSLRSHAEYELATLALADEVQRRKEVESSLTNYDQPNFYIPGYCAVCGEESVFNTSFMYSCEHDSNGRQIPNWREHLDCTGCGFTNRIRAAIHYFYGMLRPSCDAEIYLTEQTTPLYRWLKGRHPRLVGSEYFGSSVAFGGERDGVRNEDLTRLTFPAATFDFVLSFDVMEHVSDDIAAFHEVYRCLKPGGIFLFGAPFSKDSQAKLIRAQLNENGEVHHLLTPEFHGNPVDPENGALCFRYFAWDILDDLRAVGFHDPRVVSYWSRDFAYLGVEQFIFVASKSAG